MAEDKKPTRATRTEKYNVVLDTTDIDAMLKDRIKKLTGNDAVNVRAQLPETLNVYYDLEKVKP